MPDYLNIPEPVEAAPASVAVIIPAGGTGVRFGPVQPKQFADLAGWPILAHTLSRFDQAPSVDHIVVVVPADKVSQVRTTIVEPFGFAKVTAVVAGGDTRQASVYEGFMALEDTIDLVVVHDGVRPLVSVSVIEEVIDQAREHGAAIAAIPARDTLKRVEDGVIQETIDRRLVWQAQTPQAFQREIFAEALSRARLEGFAGTDEASLVERLGQPVRVVPGASENIKITLPEDLILAENMVNYGQENCMRVGIGYDVHPLVPGRRMMLGGVEIPFDLGLAGHSDADVIVHAFCDALLGAAGLGDIGQHFPDSDRKWAGAEGARLLRITGEKVHRAGYVLHSADLILLAEAPKIKDYRDRMVQAMAGALAVDPSKVNVKATTTEKLGFVGREEGLAAMAVVCLGRIARRIQPHR